MGNETFFGWPKVRVTVKCCYFVETQSRNLFSSTCDTCVPKHPVLNKWVISFPAMYGVEMEEEQTCQIRARSSLSTVQTNMVEIDTLCQT